MKKSAIIPVCLLVGYFFNSCNKNDQVTIDISTSLNRPPIANAGRDVAIELPVNCIVLHSSQSIAQDTKWIENYRWKKISGPDTFIISNHLQQVTRVKNLVKGDYEFELTITDNKGLSSKDSVKVEVFAAPQPPAQLPWPSPSSSSLKEIINTNLVWHADYCAGKAFATLAVLPPSPGPYSVDNVLGVYIGGGLFAQGSYYQFNNYVIQNNSIVLIMEDIGNNYEEYSIKLDFSPKIAKVTFR